MTTPIDCPTGGAPVKVAGTDEGTHWYANAFRQRAEQAEAEVARLRAALERLEQRLTRPRP